MNVSNEELKHFTLGWCNDVVQDAIRKAQGMSLHRSIFEVPKVPVLLGGMTSESSRCVIARTLSEALGSPASVNEYTQIWMEHRTNEPWMWSHPPFVREFISRFDHGQMPELDLDSLTGRQVENERQRRASRYKEWQSSTREMQDMNYMYKGCPTIKTACDMPYEPMKAIDWSKEMGLERVAVPETA